MSRLELKYRYYGFISYNHRDERVAKWLQRQLEHYRLPAVARKEIGDDIKIRPIFRYAVNLSLGDLRKQVKEELDASRFLIVICSPNSAQPNIKGKHWVNDEVLRFIETGRTDDIIPVIVDGEPNVGGNRECFPPALRNIEIAGANLSKGSRSKRHRDFLKIVAKLLGLLPDQLIQHTAEEEKLSRLRFWLKMLPLLILAAAGGLFAWDSTRTVQNYYADYVDSYGLPEGIFPLKKSEIKHRNVHYRFEYRGFQFGNSPHTDSADWCIWELFGLRRRLVRVVQANSLGYPRTLDHSQYKDRPQIQDFTYDKDQRLCEIRYGRYNGEDHKPYLEMRIELSMENGQINNLLQFFKNEGRLGKAYAIASTSLSDDSTLMSKSDIVQHLVTRDNKGRIERRMFLNTSGANVQDSDGLYGFGYEHDDYGRVTAKWYLFRDGGSFSRRANKKGVAGQKYQYSGRNMKTEEYVNQSGRPVLGPRGWMVEINSFDANDNIIEKWCYDDLGEKMYVAEGFSGIRTEYDVWGNATRQTYLGKNEEPMLHKDGYAEVQSDYDERGNITKVSFFSVDGKPTLHKDGYAEVRADYDERGNKTRLSYFGIDDKPTLLKDGYAEARADYDERGNMTRLSYFGVDGKPSLHKDGYAEVQYDYDERGNLTRLSYFGVDGKPSLHKDGNAEVQYDYDERGNETKVSYFGVDGKPTLHKDGYAEIQSDYDERGNITKVSFFDIDGKPTPHKDGYAKVRTDYDERGNITRLSYFGVDGKPSLHNDGNAGWEAEYNERALETKRVWLGIDGKPTLLNDGYAKVQYDYDKCGNITKESYFNIDGNPTLHKDGYAKVWTDYDERGNITKMSYFGVDGKPRLDNDGCAGWEAEYNERALETKRVWLGIDGKPTLLIYGFAGWAAEYNERALVTKRVLLGIDGKPTLLNDGYAEVRTDYDEHGNITKMSYFGVDGELILDDNPVEEKAPQ